MWDVSSKMEEDEPKPRPGCVGLLTDEVYAAVLLVRGLGKWGYGSIANAQCPMEPPIGGKCGNGAPRVGGGDLDPGE